MVEGEMGTRRPSPLPARRSRVRAAGLKRGHSRRAALTLLAVTSAAALAGCGGGKADGVEVDQSTPEGAAVAYVRLIDTCDPKAAQRAFELALDSDEAEEEAMERVESDALEKLGSDGDPEPPGLEKTRAQLFDQRGACDSASQRPLEADEIATEVYDEPGGVPPFGDPEGPLPAATVLVRMRGGDLCEGESEGLAATKSEGKWLIAAEETGEVFESDQLASGCVGED